MDHDEPTLADLMSDPVTLAVMNADGVHPGDLAAALTKISASFAASPPETVDQEDRANMNGIFRSVPADRKSEVEPPLREATRTSWDRSVLRHHLRLVSGLILLAFVLCHLTAHSFLLVSQERAEGALDTVMYPWRSVLGTTILVSALLIHYLNALWSIYVRRYLRLSRWEGWQLGLGLCIPLLLMLHVAGTRVAESVLGVSSHYSSVLLMQWRLSPWLGILQAAAVLTVWIHACIGIHFWLRTKARYMRWRALFVSVGLLLPTLALSGYVTAGNQVLRATTDPNYTRLSLEHSNLTDQKRTEIGQIAQVGSFVYLSLTLLPFIGRGVRGCLYRRRRPPLLSHSSGRRLPILPGATVLETLRENGIAHASVCGGRARCTTCRILVTKGLDRLPEPSRLEAKALARIGATPGMRLACQIRPTADISVMPLLPADAGAAEGAVRGGLEGNERLITVLFVDLRGSTDLGESKMPYDLLFILNQFFHEMTKALDATNGHYAQFAGDGLMALYGLNAKDPAVGASDALRGAREMMARMDQLNSRLRGDLLHPLRIGIGIHFGEAIVGAMGPPGSQVISAIGETANACSRLEGLTKRYDCRVVVSRRAAETADLDVGKFKLHSAWVNGVAQPVEFYALNSMADLRV
ncbi:MAG TPA: adenylate/guanylate cyclase domain-containing protein [Xanthobacteraceae bacterium]|jgi:adenylate cyclase